MIFDSAKSKGLNIIIRKVSTEIWVQTETSPKNQFAPAHIATNNATPKA